MSVFRINKTNNFTVMSNYHLQDKNLSYKAKGLLSYMLSLPEDWCYSVKGLSYVSMEGVKAINSILKELERNNYIIRKRMQGSHGKFYYEYNIYETPYTQKGIMDEGYTVDGIQINTNIINNKKEIDKDDKLKSSFFMAEEHNILTVELINIRYIDKNDIQLFYYDDLFNELLNNNTYKDLIKIIHYITKRIVNNEFRDENGNIINNKFGYLKNAIINNIDKLKINLDNLW